MQFFPFGVLVFISKKVSLAGLAVTTVMMIFSLVNSWKSLWGVFFLAFAGVALTISFLSGPITLDSNVALTNVYSYNDTCAQIWQHNLGISSLAGLLTIWLFHVCLAIKQFGACITKQHWFVKAANAVKASEAQS
jgi:hypothetical protein